MKKFIEEESQESINTEMLAAISKLTRAGFLLVIVLLVLFWQNFNLLFKNNTTIAQSSVDYVSPVLSATAQKGKTIFQNNCANCHVKDMRTNLTGPALGGVTERWAAYPRRDLYKWVRNSQAMIQQKHPRALVLWKEWYPTVMNAFNDLKDEDIEAILTYVEEQYAAR